MLVLMLWVGADVVGWGAAVVVLFFFFFMS